MDWILRAIHAIGAVHHAQIRQRDIAGWAMRKFKRFNAHKIRASHFLQKLARDDTGLFVHWQIGLTGTFA